MPEAAAYFDLDRTLLLGGSGPTIAAAMREHGLLRTEGRHLGRALFGLFDLVGETLPSMLLTRQGARAAKGWRRSDVQAVGREVAPRLADLVEPFAEQALDEHRSAGRKLVLATTTPHDLVDPFGEMLGFDAVLATRYGLDDDGRYTGTIDGEFVWSRGKARSAEVWARANQVDLLASYAYSDSIYDVPLLSLVGHPVAVNPDPRLLLYARGRGWPTVWFNAPPGVPKPGGVEPQDVLGRLARPELYPWLRLDVDGLDHLPRKGGVLLVSNHRSYLDPLIIGFLGGRIGRPIRFLAKKEITDAPIVGPITTALGAIRVDRGSGSNEPLERAASALTAGEVVATFPQGTIPRGDDLLDPKLVGRPGAARLALETGAPIVPIGLWGTEAAWPRTSRFPYVLNLADPPTIRVRVGEPFHPESDDPAEVTEELLSRVRALLPAE